ncbi:MAG: nucleoside triphosphate pyrophosphohydrolase [Spirochaetes bacterium]|nr:nucleoside triphosphate pyrophosphohydrolase [Spirochaetota bacterium]
MNDLRESFDKFYNIIIKLRSKDGCPWDREQTANSVRTNLLEEVYECIEAISKNDDFHTAEELGDILLVISFIARIKEEENAFTFKEVIERVSEKLIRRHPHVFAKGEASSFRDSAGNSGEDPSLTKLGPPGNTNTVTKTADEVLKNWELIKKAETSRNETGEKEKAQSKLDVVSKSIPPLERAYRFQKKASKAGFDWSRAEDVLGKIKEEISELEQEISAENKNKEKIEEEIGDILFSVINLARFLKIDPSIALHGTNEKFLSRFKKVEKGMEEKGLPMKQENLKIMDALWEAAKLS